MAFDTALTMSESNGADLGLPWIDPASGELVVSVVTDRGRTLISNMFGATRVRLRDVTHGAAELRRIQDDVTFLGSRGVPDAGLIYMSLPDQRDNRTLVVISAMSRTLLDYLAAHYPADAMAVQVAPQPGLTASPIPA